MARKQTAAYCERLSKWHQAKADHYAQRGRDLKRSEKRIGFRYTRRDES